MAGDKSRTTGRTQACRTQGQGRPQGQSRTQCPGRNPRTRSRVADFLRTMRADAPWLIPCAGTMGLCQSLMYIPFVLGPAGKGLGAQAWWDPVPTMVFFLVLSATMLVDLVAARRGALRVINACTVNLPQAVCFAAGQLLLVLQGLAEAGTSAQLAIACAGGALAGYATACAQLSSARFLARLRPDKSFEVILAAQVPTVIVMLYALLSPSVWFGLPFVAFAEVARRSISVTEDWLPFEALLASGTGTEQLGSSTPALNLRAGIVTGCTVALCALTTFVARSWLEAASGAAVGWTELGVFAGVSAAVLLTVCFLGLATKTLSLTLVFRVAIPSVAAAAVLVAFTGGTDAAGIAACHATMALTLFAMILTDQMVWLLTAGFMRANESASEVTVTTMRTCQFLGATAGAGLVPALAHVWGIVPTLFCALAVLLVAFVVCIPTFEPHLVSPGKSVPDQLKGLDATDLGRYALVVSRFGLTAREAEVLSLLAKGADAAAIADQLVITLSTANTHIRHIYAKLGVHSRQEMLAKAATPGDEAEA